MNKEVKRVEKEIGGKTLSIETGKLATQAHGSVVVQYGETVVLVAVLTDEPSREVDFFPLFVDYRENTYSAGKIPGGFFKREGRPTTKEILTMRMIDRPIRPLFPKDFKNEVQIQCMVLSSDGSNDPDLMAMIGASAALSISPAPFKGPIGCARVGYVDGEYVVNPTLQQLDESSMSLIGAGPPEALNMLEMAGMEVSEEVVAGATDLAQKISLEIIGLINELVEACGITKEYESAVLPEDLVKLTAERCEAKIREQKTIPGKTERNDALKETRQELLDELIPEGSDPDELPYTQHQIKEAFYKLEGKIQRELILSGTRPDGRQYDELRHLGVEVNVLPRTHGSAIFVRGETQAMTIATLGTPRDQQIIDGLYDEYKKQFYLHYNFPPFSVGEIRPIRGPGRREIGHGMLAEKSLQPVLPDPDEFPYTIRLVSEILESNGSTSQASVCSGSLAMLAAGIPLKAPVAGISIGMVSDEAGKYALLTDIVGEEDFHGDMDFKVAGTVNGITAIQLDMKVRGITQDRIVETLEQAKQARFKIIDAMNEVISDPAEISEYAPRMLSITIPVDKIGKMIGPGGKMINKIQSESGATIDVEDDGTIYIASQGPGAEIAAEMIKKITEEAKLGETYKGTVVSTRDFGAFIEILPGTEGLCHVSELSMEYVDNVEDVCKPGDEMDVKVINIDNDGKVKVSRKAVLDPDWEPAPPPPKRDRGGGRGGRGGGRDRRGGGGGRR